MDCRTAVAAVIASVVLLSVAHAAEDIAGAADHPLIGARFPEAVITTQELKEFDEYTLITGPIAREGEVATGQVFEGRITTTVYEIPAVRTTLEVFRNYENKLAQLGLETIYHCSDRDCGGREFNLTVVPYIHGFGGNEDGQRYLAARAEGPDGTTYVSLYVVKNYSVGGPTRNRVYVRLVVIEVEEMKTELVVVEADEMQRQIADTGRVALYGILFEFDSAEILPDSRPALTEIAKLMGANPDLEILVVGHTDNAGSHDYNMSLSSRRAEAVRAALIGDFGISPSRLSAHGVGFLSPTAPNTTEDGRARNRRVELVAR